jgi:cobalamin synthase
MEFADNIIVLGICAIIVVIIAMFLRVVPMPGTWSIFLMVVILYALIALRFRRRIKRRLRGTFGD